MKRNQPRAPQASRTTAASSDEFMRSAQAWFDELEELKTRPRTTAELDAQLARIWPLWNALPTGMLAEERRAILDGGHNSEHHRHLSMLRRQFPKPKFPLSPDILKDTFTLKELKSRRLAERTRAEHNQALEAAAVWTRLMDFLHSTHRLHQNLVTRQWAFADADAHAAARVAIVGAAREIALTHPGLLQNTSPTMAQILHLADRYHAYTAARQQALAALVTILYKAPGVRTGKPVPFTERAGGVPNPPDDVPRYLYIARLDALGICSPARLEEFLRAEYPRLPRARRMRFDRMRRRPRYGKNPFAGFLVWLLDNRPILEHPAFGWQWNEIQAASH
jgi:hypothetical protein